MKNIFLSPVEKEMLIKAILEAMAILIFTMSVFKLPIKLCNDMNIIFQNFGGGSNRKRGRIQWRKWENMGGQKGKRGLEFRDLGSFKLALLAKQG